MAKSSTPVGGINGQPQAWWSPKVKDQVSESRRAIAAAHRSDEDCQAYISVSRNASSGIVKTKAEARQAICSSLSFESDPKSVYTFLRFVTGSSSSSSLLLTFPTVLLPESWHRSMPNAQPKILRTNAIGYLSELRRATCPKESYFSFPLNFS